MVVARGVGRWLIYSFAAGLFLLLSLRIGLGIYLNSTAGKEMIAKQIAARIGLPVEVHSLSLGWRSSSISLQVLDPDSSTTEREILKIDAATADLSLFDFIRGNYMPNKLDLEGVSLRLRLDASGKVLTPLPKIPESSGPAAPLPQITLTGGRLSIKQAGRSDFSVENLALKVTPEEASAAAVTGEVDDARWSKWKVAGSVNAADRSWWLDLSTESGPLALEQMKSIPIVPAALWDHIQPDGRGAIDLHLNQTPPRDLDYSVKIRPAAASITLTDAGARLTGVGGLVQVDGAHLELQGLHGNLAGGSLQLDGAIDIVSNPLKASLKVAATGLDLRELPNEWNLPKDIQGKLRGNADLTLLIDRDGHVETQGGGRGTIEDASIRGIPVSIDMRLVSDGKRYRFENPPAPRSKTRNIRRENRKAVLCANQTQPKKDDTPTDLTANVKLRNVEISELLDKLNIKLGYKIAGKVSAEVSMTVPLEHVSSSGAYEFTGKLSSPALQLEGLVIHDLAATVVYKDGKLTLTELTGRIEEGQKSKVPPGRFRGTALVERNPPGDVRLNFSFERIPLGEIMKAIPGWSMEVSGLVSGKAEFKTSYAQLSEPKAWLASAELNAPELTVAGRKLTGLKVAVEVKNATATLKNTSVAIEGIPVTAEATLSLTDRYAFTAALRTSPTQATDLRKLVPGLEVPPIEGLLEIESKLKGTVSPFTFQAEGQITARKLTLANNPANNIAIKWQLTPEKLVVSSLEAAIFEGTLTGSADLPLSGQAEGKFELAFKDINSRDATSFVPNFPIQITGKVSGKVSGKLAPPKPGQSRVGEMEVSLTAPKLTVQGIPTDQLSGTASINREGLAYKLEGKALGGSFELQGRYPGEKSKAPAPKPKSDRGTFKLTGLNLARVSPEMRLKSLAPLRGQIDVAFEFDNDLSSGSGRISVRELGWGPSLLARELTGVLVLQDGQLELAELGGRIAGGELRTSARVDLKEPKKNSFLLSLRDADARRLLAVIPEFAKEVDGPVSLVVRGHFGNELRGSGRLSLSRGTISGVGVADLRIPFDWAIAPGGVSGRLTVREATANTGNGKLEGKLTLVWGFDAYVDGLVQFTNVPLRAIVPELGSYSLFGNGRITGRLSVGGSHVRSLDDLTGSLVANLHQTSVKEIPILQAAISFLNVAGLTQPFQSGVINGTLSKSVFRIQKLALVNPGAQVFAEGIITLGGRIDMAVVAHTGPQGLLMKLFAIRLPPIGPLPLTLIQDVTEFLANRTIRLNITGTTRDPVVRVNTGALLSEEAIRFLLARYVIPADAAGSLGLGFESGVVGK